MQPATNFPEDGAGARLVKLVAEEGSGAEALVVGGIQDLRSLCSLFVSDVAHYLCVLHGRFPGLVDHAARHTADPEAREWMLIVTEAFGIERTFLTKLTVAAGPVVSGHSDENCAQAFAAQSHAFEMLGTSDRQGCSVGAALAFVQDWLAIRPLLDVIAMRVGIDTPANRFPTPSDNIALAEALAAKGEAVERALFFGAKQLLAQQRAYWRLMAARAEARARLG